MKWVLHNNAVLSPQPPMAGEIYDSIPAAIWSLEQEPLTGIFFLKKISESFEMPEKVYGVEDRFVKKIDVVARNMKRHIGMVFSGDPGSGKTITAKRICNNLLLDQNIPTILINQDLPGLAEFIAGVPQKIIFLFDEYEKVFKTEEQESKLLTVLDGVLTTGQKKLFIMTRNKAGMHYAMKDRPSRIRYYKEFGRLSESVVREVLEDRLQRKDLLEESLSYLKSLRTLTMDMVNEVIQEIDVTGETPQDFNADERTYYGLFIFDRKTNKWIEVGKEERFNAWDVLKPQDQCWFGKNTYGFLKEVISYNEFMVEYPNLNKVKKAVESVKDDDSDSWEEEVPYDLNNPDFLKLLGKSFITSAPKNPLCVAEGIHRYRMGVCREGEFQNFERQNYYNEVVNTSAWG